MYTYVELLRIVCISLFQLSPSHDNANDHHHRKIKDPNLSGCHLNLFPDDEYYFHSQHHPHPPPTKP